MGCLGPHGAGHVDQQPKGHEMYTVDYCKWSWRVLLHGRVVRDYFVRAVGGEHPSAEAESLARAHAAALNRGAN